MKFLVTGAAGFVGFHLTRLLVAQGHSVVGLDGFAASYETTWLEHRAACLPASASFRLVRANLLDAAAMRDIVAEARPDIVVHLAARAGVRQSLQHPLAYMRSNVSGTAILYDALAAHAPRHMLVASSSSVYGHVLGEPAAEREAVLNPLSPYASSKVAVEQVSRALAGAFAIPTTCCRFFTVYGPYGRPDMAPFIFSHALWQDDAITIYGDGRAGRDMTYVGDVVQALARLADVAPVAGRAVSARDSIAADSPWRVVNIAGPEHVAVIDLVKALEARYGRTARLAFAPANAADALVTRADRRLLHDLVGDLALTPFSEGLSAFTRWFTDDAAPLLG